MTVLLLIASLGLLALSLTPRLPARPHVAVDLPSHFTVQYSFAAIILFALSLWFHTGAAASFSVLGFIACFLELTPLLPANHAAPVQGPGLKILQVNLLKSNRKPELLKAYIAEQRPDIISCCEVNADFAAMLRGLEDYPHQLITTGTNDYRVAVLSKLPFDKIEQAAFGGARTDAVVFRVTQDGKTVDGVSLHPYTPIRNIGSRDGEFAAVAARFAAEAPARLMLMGDFNATPWCPAMKKLCAALSLRNARRGRGLQTSWPVFLPFLFRIPIDHVLVSAKLDVASFAIGRNIGSDHLPTLTVVLPK